MGAAGFPHLLVILVCSHLAHFAWESGVTLSSGPQGQARCLYDALRTPEPPRPACNPRAPTPSRTEARPALPPGPAAAHQPRCARDGTGQQGQTRAIRGGL